MSNPGKPAAKSVDTLEFYLNQQRILLHDVDPSLLLVDWLRLPEVGMTGTKKSCGQGGCGACTVMLSEWDARTETVRHRAINACLRPVASLAGKQVTTVEGVGSVETGMSPVQWRMAVNNASQCGFCTPGWVMAMHAHLTSKPGSPGTQAEIEQLFDGNLCRCTGYRPILYAMKQFASDYRHNPAQMTCLVPPMMEVEHSGSVAHCFPAQLKAPADHVYFDANGYTWHRPLTLNDLNDWFNRNGATLDGAKLVAGNTSIGVYDRYQEDPRQLLDIGNLPELHGFSCDGNSIQVGAGETYAQFIEHLDELLAGGGGATQSALQALRYMAHRTAGAIVRNAASLAGNTMLVTRHVHTHNEAPFPSDLFTVLCCLDTEVEVCLLGSPMERLRLPLHEFAEHWGIDDRLRSSGLLVSYHIPLHPDAIVSCYKTALREVNSHSIVNAACRVQLDADHRIMKCNLVFAGIDALAFRAREVEALLLNQRLDNCRILQDALDALRNTVSKRIRAFAERASRLPSEGFADGYLISLAETYLYKFYLDIAQRTAPDSLPPDVLSATVPYQRPISSGTQKYEHESTRQPVGEPYVSRYAFLQATGEAIYTHDLDPSRRGAYGVMAVSTCARARVHYQIPDKSSYRACTIDELIEHLRITFTCFIGYVTFRDLPEGGSLNLGFGDIHDDIVLSMDDKDGVPVGYVNWQGQPLGLVCASELMPAEIIAHYVQSRCVNYQADNETALLSIDQALAENSVFKDCMPYPVHIEEVKRRHSNLDWLHKSGSIELNGVACTVVNSRQFTAEQIHFYMETQSALATPTEHDEMIIDASTQSPDSVQSAVQKVLNIAINQVRVRARRLGGAYGGKTTRSVFAAAPAALAAHALNRPVLFQMPRESDTPMFGHRHPVQGEAKLAIADGSNHKKQKGRILGWCTDFVLDGGWTYDCSFVVSDCIQLRADNAYMVPNYRTLATVVRTNKTSNTAFRAFGMIQAVLIQETALDAAATEIAMLPEDVREKNLYAIGDRTPFGQKLDYCYQKEVWRYARDNSDFDKRLLEVNEFNKRNRWRKRGLCLLPVKYGSGYNLAAMEQAGAYVEVYTQDGSILLRHGGIEMGQGISIKIIQIAAMTLELPMNFFRMAEMDTAVIPNPESTGASTGTAYNGGAVRKACKKLKRRLRRFAADYRKRVGDKTCESMGIAYWLYSDGWAHDEGRIWRNLVALAHTERMNLSAQVRFRQSGGTSKDRDISFIDNTTEVVDQFVGYTYSAACSEVEVDMLTGECTILRSDIYYDSGHSLNPAIDIGQIEGGFVQGIGMILTENVVFQQAGPDRGRLTTTNTWRYKPPAYTTIPIDLRVELFPRETVPRVKENTNELLSAKEVGEPPLVLSASVYLALKQAVRASRRERNKSLQFDLPVPATVQQVRAAAEIEASELVF